MIGILHSLGIRFMQLSYNHAGPLATGWVEEEDDQGITELGRAAIAEMNRVGLVIDMSHPPSVRPWRQSICRPDDRDLACQSACLVRDRTQ